MTLHIRSLHFRYAGSPVDALAGVDLDVPPGSLCRILGPHASGKSTLLHCIAGVAPELRPGAREGEITLAGEDLARGRVRDRIDRVALVFQDFETQLFSTTVELEVAFGPENLGLPPEETRRRVAEALARVGLGGFEKRAPATLSGGEKQRLAIACALAMRPRLLLLDDPASELDPRAREQARVWAFADADDRSVLWVEPDPEAVADGERVAWLEGGRKKADGPAGQVFAGRRDMPPDAAPDLGRLFSLLGEVHPILDVDAAALWLKESGWEPAADPAPRAERPAAGHAIVEVRGLSHAYESGAPVLRGVDLEVGEGECVAILGPNGSGKTTLVRCLCGLLRPSAGEVRVSGARPTEMPRGEVAGRIGYVTQNPDHQIFSASVREELLFGPLHRRVPERVWREQLAAVLEALELEGVEDRDPFALPKGDRQRVAVGAILMNDPAVLVLDEPTTGLDPVQQARLMRRLESLRAQGRAIVMVTHSLRLAARFAHRVVLLSGGRVVADGPAGEILSDAAALEAAGLAPLPITRLAWRLGARAATPETLVRALHQRRGGTG